MTEKLKDIIKNAKAKDKGEFQEFLIIPTDEIYDGFWGKNGFNEMIVLAGDLRENKWFKISCGSDAFRLQSLMYNGIGFDVPSDLGCIRIFLDKPVSILGGVSSIIAYPKEWG